MKIRRRGRTRTVFKCFGEHGSANAKQFLGYQLHFFFAFLGRKAGGSKFLRGVEQKMRADLTIAACHRMNIASRRVPGSVGCSWK
ncbi:hypothetical protein chiPu_0004192 [Chiloscyllium punctatum]|uniref:Uncharacterized protein n=1 Tax=Chiloscyllium punctatum TaxID=137246 RepID=A0A401S5W9_CHIPU|nr:hypothetical protein [Chiloscyllium punctatum]